MRLGAVAIAVACVVMAGCARRQKRPGEAISEEERGLAMKLMDGCAPRPSANPDELLLYCPDQALLFGAMEIDRMKPEQVFEQWLAELTKQAEGKLEVVERTESKHFGPGFVALYVRMKTPDTPPDGYVEGYVAATEVSGKPRRVWCTAISSEPSGLYRCEQDLPVMAALAVP
jgi:hypothetical protein